jgi:transcription elongation factor Elf1
VFVHVSEESVDNELRRGQTFCKDCENLTTLRLVERVRTVTAYWIVKSSERNHFLICDGCGAQFRVKRSQIKDLEYTDIDSLMRMAGRRFVPFFTRIIVFLAVISAVLPVFGLLLTWMAYRDRIWLTPAMLKALKFALWVNLALTAVMVIALATGRGS